MRAGNNACQYEGNVLACIDMHLCFNTCQYPNIASLNDTDVGSNILMFALTACEYVSSHRLQQVCLIASSGAGKPGAKITVKIGDLINGISVSSVIYVEMVTLILAHFNHRFLKVISGPKYGDRTFRWGRATVSRAILLELARLVVTLVLDNVCTAYVWNGHFEPAYATAAIITKDWLQNLPLSLRRKKREHCSGMLYDIHCWCDVIVCVALSLYKVLCQSILENKLDSAVGCALHPSFFLSNLPCWLVQS